MASINPSSLRTAAVFAAFVSVLGLAKYVPMIPTETEATQSPGDESLSEEMKHQLIEKYGNTFPSYLTGYDYEGSQENSAVEELITTVADVLGDFQYRMESYGTEKDEWMPKLLKKIPKDQLALKYGGVSDFKPVEFHG